MLSLETRVLWLHQAVRWGLIELETMPLDDKLADLGMKTLRVQRRGKMRIALNMADAGSAYAERRLDPIRSNIKQKQVVGNLVRLPLHLVWSLS